MSDRYYFPAEFKCLYCKEDFDPDGGLALASGDQIDLTCPKCRVVWKFGVKVELNQQLVQGGKYDATQELLSTNKRFLKWIGLKERLDQSTHEPPLVSRGDIWWASVGKNVGSEINGKNNLFSRPVVVLKKLARGFYFIVPTTTQIREGTWYIPFCHQETGMIACLHQARAIDHRRLSSKIGTIDDEDFARIKNGFNALYK